MLVSAKSLLAALELALVAGLAAFAGSLTITNGTVTVKDLVSGAVAAGIAVLYSVTKSLGAIQASPAPTPPIALPPAPLAPAPTIPIVPAPAQSIIPPPNPNL